MFRRWHPEVLPGEEQPPAPGIAGPVPNKQVWFNLCVLKSSFPNGKKHARTCSVRLLASCYLATRVPLMRTKPSCVRDGCERPPPI